MQRTTVSLPDDIARVLALEARRRNVSASAIAREALASHLGLSKDKPRELPFAAARRSGHGTTARDMERLIEREWGEPARDR